MRAAGARRRHLAVAVLGVAAVAAPSPALAAGPVFSVGPTERVPYVKLAGAPGARLAGSVRVTNSGDEPGTALLYPVDATTGVTTGAVYLGREAPRRGVGSWLALDRDRVSLGAGRSATVAFTVAVPADASPGEHLGGVVAEPPAPRRGRAARRGRSSFRIDIRRLSIVAALVTVPGRKVARLSVTGLSAGARTGYQTLLVGMRSAGNVMVRGHGLAVVRDGDGKLARRARFGVDTFVPGTAVRDPVPVGGRALRPGRYHGDVTVEYGVRGTGHVARWSGDFTVTDSQLRQVFAGRATQPPGGGGGSPIPWIVAALGLGLGATAMLRSRRPRAGRAP